jgi:hypothetical protein
MLKTIYIFTLSMILFACGDSANKATSADSTNTAETKTAAQAAKSSESTSIYSYFPKEELPYNLETDQMLDLSKYNIIDPATSLSRLSPPVGIESAKFYAIAQYTVGTAGNQFVYLLCAYEMPGPAQGLLLVCHNAIGEKTDDLELWQSSMLDNPAGYSRSIINIREVDGTITTKLYQYDEDNPSPDKLKNTQPTESKLYYFVAGEFQEENSN